MKTLLSFCLALFISQAAFSQMATVKKPSHYILPEFVKGIIKMKTGTIFSALNYNTYLETMVIQQGDERRMLAGLEMIDTVYLGARKFIPEGKGFYEVVQNPTETFYIHHTCRIKTPGQTVGYGGTSQLSNSSSPATKESSGIFFKNFLPDNYIVVPQQSVFIKKDKTYVELNSTKKVAELFPAKAEAIKGFVKANKTDFYNADDVTKLVMAAEKM